MACKNILFARSNYLLELFLAECQKDQKLANMVRELKFVLINQDDLSLVSQDSISSVDSIAGIYSLTKIQNNHTQFIIKYLTKELEEEDQYLLAVYNTLPKFGIKNELSFYSDLLFRDLSTIGGICCLVDNKQTSAEQALKHVIHINMEQMNNTQMNTKIPAKKLKRGKKNYCISFVRFNTVKNCLVQFYQQKMKKDLVNII
jgi:hypothetical protein